MHTVAVIALSGVVPFDLSTPCEVFGRVRLANDRAGYDVRVCGLEKEVPAGAFTLRPRWGLRTLANADTVVIPGVADPSRRVGSDPVPGDPRRTACFSGSGQAHLVPHVVGDRLARYQKVHRFHQSALPVRAPCLGAFAGTSDLLNRS